MAFTDSSSSNTHTARSVRPLWKDPLLWIFLLGLGIRLIHGLTLTQTLYAEINTEFQQGDTRAFYQWAHEIMAGDWLGRDTFHTHVQWMQDYGEKTEWYRWWGGEAVFHQAPLYPYLLAIQLSLTGGSVNGVFLIQLLLGSLQPLILFALARQLFNRRVGLWAALLTALYGPFVFHQATLLRDWMIPIIEPVALLLVLLALRRDRWWLWMCGGGVLALAYQAKPSALILTVMTFAFLTAVHGLTLWRPAIGLSPRALPRRAGLLLAGLVLVLMPLMIRNQIVGAPLLSVSTRGAEALIQGNAVDAEPVGYHRPESMADLLRYGDGDNKKMLSKLLADYQGDYGALLGMQLNKWLYLFDVAELPNNLDISFGQRISPILRPLLSYAMVLPLGLLGVFLAWRRMRHKPVAFALTLSFLLATMFALTIPLILGRYRMALVPYWILFGGWALHGLILRLRHRRYRAVVLWTIGLGLAVVFQQVVIYHTIQFDRLKMTFHAPEYLLSRQIHLDRNRFDLAADASADMIARWKQLGGGWIKDEDLLRMGELENRLKSAERMIEDGYPEAARQQLLKAETSYLSFPHDQGQPFFDIAAMWRKLDEPEHMRRNLHIYLERHPTGFDVPIAEQWLKETETSCEP